MANSKITITFTADLSIGDQLGIEIGFDTNPVIVSPQPPGSYAYKWVSVRSGSGQVTTGIPTLIPGERAAINFVTAFNLDATGFLVTRFGNVVVIEFVNQVLGIYSTVAIFATPITVFDFTSGNLVPYINDPSINFVIFNASQDIFSVDTMVYSTALIPCTHAKITATTNVLATKILSPVVVNPNSQNPFNFEVLRGSSFVLQLENVNGTQITQTITAPDILNSANFTIQINNSPNGATLVIQNTNTFGLTLSYSLDNSTWITSGTFSGIAVGNYTLYVKDQLGCSFSKPFNINAFGIYVPYFYISKSNSFRFANRIIFGDSSNYKNDENTLSCEVDVKLAYKEIQQFQSADVITTQFRSNYSLNIAKVVREDLTEVNVPVIKMTNNIGIKYKCDARQYDLGNGKTGVYFISGNVYDYVSNIIISQYSLNGLLPEFAEINNYITINNAWFLIEDIVFDESKNADVIVFSNVYIGPEINTIVSSVFNRENYDVYEFTVDMVNYIDEKFRVRLEMTDPNYVSITNLTEVIFCKVKHERVLEIAYKNTTNTDIMYSTGIEHKIRIPYIKIVGKSDENSEVHKTDTNAILLNADLYEVDEIHFEPVTKEIWRKITQALSHEKVLINGIGYVKNGNFNTEGSLDESNLYLLTATMIKTGSVYNSQTGGSAGFNGSQVQVPGLISTQSGFVSY